MEERKHHILVVDDEPDAVEFIKAILTADGHTVTSAENGTSGLEKARQEHPDAIILDVQMPGKGGFDVFNELKMREDTKGIPVIMLTGIADKLGMRFSGKEMERFMDEEPAAYLEKPIEPEVLRNTLKKVLD